MADVSFILDEAEATIRRIADSSANGFSDMDGLILEAERLLRDVLALLRIFYHRMAVRCCFNA